MKKPRVTAAELMARLHANPEWVAARAKEEEHRQKFAAEMRDAEAPLVKELREAGFDIQSVWDLVNTSKSYSAALPILLEHLQRAYPAPIREGIARSLAVPPARFGWDILKKLFREEQRNRAKDGLAVAIAATADDSLIDQVIALARDRELGTSRNLLLRALARSKVPRAREALIELDADPELQVEVQNILRRLAKRKKR
jgi:hypothetical protein